MSIASVAINNRIVTLVLTVVMLIAGLYIFNGMSRLEDPEFTIKDALIITPYNGASALEVEQEVTELLEKTVQQLGELDKVTSKSERGLSTITVTIKEQYNKETLPQVWNKLRQKIDDVKYYLPPGAGPSLVIDDYGDVYSIFMVVSGDGYSFKELKTYVNDLQQQLLLVNGVGKITTFGEKSEAIYIEFNRSRMAQLGISPEIVAAQLNGKGVVVDAGRAHVGSSSIAVSTTGGFTKVSDFEKLLITHDTKQFYLSDIAKVSRGYVSPSTQLINFDGKAGIGLGISTVSGGNTVDMGEAVLAKLSELESQRPAGIEFGYVSLQSEGVKEAISGFTSSLAEAVIIVIVVLLFFMGLRSGLLIGFVLILTIAGSFIFLAPMGVALERISLGALIIALGMLVDNAIVVVDGILIRMQKGESAESAAPRVVNQSAWPLLGATLIAILAFAAIGTSNDATGEYCRSLFQVVMVSLLLSWVTAVTITPLLCVMYLKAPKSTDKTSPYQGTFYTKYRGLLASSIRHRYLSSASIIGIFALSLWGFSFVQQNFFPSSTRAQFMVDFWLPQGTHIEETQKHAESVENYLGNLANVEHVTTTIGEGALRFLLTYQPQQSNSSYAQFLVDVDDYTVIKTLIPKIEVELLQKYPDALVYASPFELGTGTAGKIQARISGPDTDILRETSDKVLEVFSKESNTKGVRTDWRNKQLYIEAVLAEEQANINGINRGMVAEAIKESFEGVTTGVYRENDLLLPIIIRANENERSDITNIENVQIWSPNAQKMIPLRQVVQSFETKFEDGLILRRNRERTITIFADPVTGTASELLATLKPQVEAIKIPPGYTLEWGGEYEDSSKAEKGLASSIPIFILSMILITIVIFNSLKQTLVIWLCVPLALIGVTAGMLATNQPFGFMALLGFLSLIGMLIKNAIVLVDEINLEQSQGKSLINSILDSGVSRLRPVAMAALTTALGMIPLIFDAFFVSMAVTIISGLMFATALTMIVLPIVYALIFKAENP
ncbi:MULTISPECIES: efflux RND transporter permease subunit [Gammaproteobacteria]|jgi:multidrug efflux pump subunit AcrB|uniref:efflux RND transporter permease subunit n=1 Tax=Gammaproteobacteria TaxID=1236 RepID=UPI001F23374B|nr:MULTISPECIES: efflux RND transporter permease subunit [Gammaproteobacteria]MCE9970017.1 efflux RND transporter permease subunit [Aeromonas salmonicida]MCU7965354.1 efflux RND transporter permease subunit [Shewanella sp. SW32]MCU7973340.1 efflux RND transporter permease subunit [Shewanella sp. SW29]MDH1997544.1 efflux RND transporter permease subunit [Aeromonas caviae]